MEQLLKEQAQARKARLAALRGQRKEVNRAPKELVADDADELVKEHKTEPVSATPTNNITTQVSQNEAPKFQISQFETVEAIAAHEQAKIMAKFNQQAISAAVEASSSTQADSSTRTKPNHVSHTKDLRLDIQDYLELAGDRTNMALNRIVHEKFLQAQE